MDVVSSHFSSQPVPLAEGYDEELQKRLLAEADEAEAALLSRLGSRFGVAAQEDDLSIFSAWFVLETHTVSKKEHKKYKRTKKMETWWNSLIMFDHVWSFSCFSGVFFEDPRCRTTHVKPCWNTLEASMASRWRSGETVTLGGFMYCQGFQLELSLNYCNPNEFEFLDLPTWYCITYSTYFFCVKAVVSRRKQRNEWRYEARSSKSIAWSPQLQFSLGTCVAQG